MTLGLTLGDVTGIGPEVAAKALARAVAEDETTYVLIGDRAVVHHLCGCLGVEETLPDWSDRAAIPSRVYLHAPEPPLPPALPAGDPSAALAAVAWLREAGRMALAGELNAIVTAPVNKESILRAGQPFVGQTEFLAGLAGDPPHAMMLLGHDASGRWLRVVLVTTHLPLQAVPAAITPEAVARTLDLADLAGRQLALPRRRIGVCGLNPHAGEGGLLGTEDVTILQPAITAARSRGLDVQGPFGADTLFHQAWTGAYDLVVAMYHDQGLPPLKLVAFENGVNWTVGLPFIRTSPDHGTAYDLAGRGVADESSMLAAIRLARELAARRPGTPGA